MALDIMIVIGVGVFLGALVTLFCLIITKKIFSMSQTETDLPMWSVRQKRSIENSTRQEGLRSGPVPEPQSSSPDSLPISRTPWAPKPPVLSPHGALVSEIGPGTASSDIVSEDRDSQQLTGSHDIINGQSQITGRGKHNWSISASDLVVFVEASSDGNKDIASSELGSYQEGWLQGDIQVVSSMGERANTTYSMDVEADGSRSLSPRAPPSTGSPVSQPEKGDSCASEGTSLQPGRPGEDKLETDEQNSPISQPGGSSVGGRPSALEECLYEEDTEEISIESSLRAAADTDLADTASTRLKDDDHDISADQYENMYELHVDIDLARTVVDQQSTTPRATTSAGDREAVFVKPFVSPDNPLPPMRQSLIPQPPPKMQVSQFSEVEEQPLKIPWPMDTAPETEVPVSQELPTTPGHEYSASGSGLDFSTGSPIFSSKAGSLENMVDNVGCQWPFSENTCDSTILGSATQEASLHLVSLQSTGGFSVTRNMLFNEKDTIEAMSPYKMVNHGDLLGSEWTLGSLSSISEGELELFMSSSSDQLRQWQDNYLFDYGRNGTPTEKVTGTEGRHYRLHHMQ